ncbi:GNAT family N-acetyltransferase [Planctomycetota bacterium]|nr:GNAT family N-acetyltransferase [Planctomycetota bacterium]
MKLYSLGHQSDFIFYEHDSQIFSHKDYIVIKTPHNPTYHFGNLILFHNHPNSNSHIDWPSIFQTHFADQPRSTHQTFLWDNQGLAAPATPGIIANFQSIGCEYDSSAVLTMQNLTPPSNPNQEIDITPLTTEQHWLDLVELKMAEPFDDDPISYRPFIENRIADYHRMTQANLGVWFGAYKNNTLVGSCGLFWSDSLARFQSVDTHPDYRRQKICTTLIHHVCQFALKHHPRKLLIIEADEDYHAIDIYRSLGFSQTERVASFSKH